MPPAALLPQRTNPRRDPGEAWPAVCALLLVPMLIEKAQISIETDKLFLAGRIQSYWQKVYTKEVQRNVAGPHTRLVMFV